MFSRALDGAVMALAALLLAGSAAGQVTAKQGEVPAEEKDVVYSSPMVLEMPANFVAIGDGEGLPYRGFERFVCEDVRLTKLAVSRTSFSFRKRDVYSFDGVIAVDDSHDRMVDLEIEIVVDGKVVAEGRLVGLDAEEKKELRFGMKIEVGPEDGQLIAAAGRAGTILRVTLSVKDNPL